MLRREIPFIGSVGHCLGRIPVVGRVRDTSGSNGIPGAGLSRVPHAVRHPAGLDVCELGTFLAVLQPLWRPPGALLGASPCPVVLCLIQSLQARSAAAHRFVGSSGSGRRTMTRRVGDVVREPSSASCFGGGEPNTDDRMLWNSGFPFGRRWNGSANLLSAGGQPKQQALGSRDSR
jgi:hypothetical protein